MALPPDRLPAPTLELRLIDQHKLIDTRRAGGGDEFPRGAGCLLGRDDHVSNVFQFGGNRVEPTIQLVRPSTPGERSHMLPDWTGFIFAALMVVTVVALWRSR